MVYRIQAAVQRSLCCGRSCYLALKGDAALTTSYRAILAGDRPTATVFANRSKARSNRIWKMHCSMRKRLSHSTLNPILNTSRSMQRFMTHNVIEAFQVMLSILDSALDTQMRVSLSKQSQRRCSPDRPFSTRKRPTLSIQHFHWAIMRSRGKIDAFKTSAEYEELLSSTLTHADLQMEHIKDVVVTYFCYVILSHR